jgi:hypothetical protein
MEASTMFGTEVAFEGGPWCRGLAGWLSGPPWSWAAQRGALGRYDWPTVAQKQKSPPRQCRAGLERRRGEAFDATG